MYNVMDRRLDEHKQATTEVPLEYYNNGQVSVPYRHGCMQIVERDRGALSGSSEMVIVFRGDSASTTHKVNRDEAHRLAYSIIRFLECSYDGV